MDSCDYPLRPLPGFRKGICASPGDGCESAFEKCYEVCRDEVNDRVTKCVEANEPKQDGSADYDGIETCVYTKEPESDADHLINCWMGN